ncbi:MAG TPA: FliM/FliN family flagellar motor switch protein [Pyrinomonadaceae bacterium]|jgi:flagellar motor switch protein FliM
MAAPNHLTETENAVRPPDAPRDPFAVDFFGGATPIADDDELFAEKEPKTRRRIKPQKKSDWHRNLPRITNREAGFSNLLSNLPENLTQNSAGMIAETLARYAFREAGQVECSIISATETNLSDAVNSLAETAQVFLTVECQPDSARAIVGLNIEFARLLIDSMLGGKGAESRNRRALSPVETTIIEFLAANVLGEINRFLGAPMLFLQDVKNEPAAAFDAFERGAEIVFNLEFGDFKGIVTLVAPVKFVGGLDKSQNPKLFKKSDRKSLRDFEKFAPAFDLRLQIGTTFLDADSLLYLEPDDIVLIEQSLAGAAGANFGADLQVFVGRGRNFRLRGNTQSNDFGGGLNFRIEEILSEDARRRFTPAKFKMDEIENDSAEETNLEATGAPAAEDEMPDEQISPSLENVQVALRVEIAGNKISLRELQNLRAGQIIALGCSPADPVRLVTDNNEEPVATGELVEIEGQLGVRLTKVFI